MNFQRKNNSSAPKGWGSHLQNALNSRLSKQLREARWLLFAALAAYFSLVLITYNPADPSWSHAVDVERINNSGGHLGAWVSDLLLTLMGYSSWWVVGLLLQLIWKEYRKMSDPILAARHEAKQAIGYEFPIEWLAGFLALLVGSMGLEAVRLHSYAIGLPNGAGGIIGTSIKGLFMGVLGFGGATLLFLVVMAAGASLFFNFSWLGLCEKIGTVIEKQYMGARYKRQSRQDRKVGVVAAQRREEEVVAKQEQLVHDEPIRIEPAMTVQPASTSFERVPDTPQAASLQSSTSHAPASPLTVIAPPKQQQMLFNDLRVNIDAALPSFELLDPVSEKQIPIPTETLEYTSRLIEKKLSDFGVSVSVVAAQAGPVITRYEMEPALGVKGSQIVNLSKDLARSLSLVSLRVVETIPGKNLMGLELPNTRRQTVKLSEILGSEVYHKSPSHVTMALGKDIAGNPVVADLAKMPHLLVAGTTGSGKSVAMNAMIISILYKATANDVRMILIDPKMLEMSVYEGIPHLLAPVVTDMRQAANALNWCVTEMDKRYKLMSHLGVRNLAGYNAKIKEAQARGEFIDHPFSLTPDQPEPLETMPMIVVMIDELADLMMVVGKKIEELIARLAQKARAAGIHLILATQRPSVDVITGLIKANIPTRIAFQVSSKIDSRTILDQMGAESLLGQGDMFYLPSGGGAPTRIHGAFVTDDEVHRVVEELKSLGGEPNYIEGILEGGVLPDNGDGSGSVTGFSDAETDPLYDQAVQVVLSNRRASISLVQRHLRIGYNRAARLLEQMERAGLVSPMQSNGNREILVPTGSTEEPI